MLLNQFLSERMKTYRRLIVFCAFLPFLVNGQVYERTGKGIGLQIQAVPFSFVESKREGSNLGNYELGAAFLRMYKPGLYYKVGYSRLITDNQGLNNLNGNFFHVGTGFDKFLSDFKPKRSARHCIYHKIGLIGEVNYSRFYAGSSRNESAGELSFKVGLSYYTHFQNMHKKVKGRTLHWEVFYFNGVTPFLSTSDNSFRRQGVGLHVRFMRHQVYNFLR